MTTEKSKFKSMLIAGCSVSAFALMSAVPNMAIAQDDDETARDEEQVLVTATKRPTAIEDVPLAITAISGAFTREVNLNDVKDLINWTPGITGNSQDSFIDAVSVRGILTNDFGVGGDPSVGFFKNNLYQGRNGVVITSLYDMDHAEALRGPQGFLFGRNAVGGAISVFTKRPDLNENNGYVELDGGQRGHFVGETAINLSSSENFGVRIAGYYSTENGYIDNLDKPTNPRVGDHEKYAVRGSALYENETVSALFTIEYEDRDQHGTAYRAIEGSETFQRLNDLFGVTIGGNGRDINEDFGFGDIQDTGWVFSLGFQLDWDLGPVALTWNTGYTDHQWLYIEDYDGTPLQLADYRQDQSGDYFQTELRLTSQTDSALSWYAGVSFYKENIDATFTGKANEGIMCAYYFAPYYEPPYYNYTPAEAAYYGLQACQYYYYTDEPYDDPLTGELIESQQVVGHYKGWAAYASLNYAVSPQFDLGIGVRYTKDTKEFGIDAFPVTSNLGPFYTLGFITAETLTDTRSWSAFTPQFIARWRPNDNVMLFASATRGFKSGGFGSYNIEELPGQAPLPWGVIGVTNADARPGDFEPEKVWSYEIGLKGTAAQGRLRYDFNIYMYRYKDLQLTVSGAGGAVIVENVGRVKGWGFEGSFQYAVSEHFDFRFAGAHARTEISEAQRACPGQVDENFCEGMGLTYVPKWSGSAFLEYHTPINGGEIRAWIEMFGQTETGGIPISVDPADVIGSYVDMSIRLGYESDSGWAIYGYVENLTNVLYYDGIFPGEAALPGVWFNPSRPRTFGVRISASFGPK